MSAQPLEIRMAHLEGAYEQVSDRLNGIDRRLENLENKVDTRFDALDRKIDTRVDAVDRKVSQVFVLIITSWITTIAAVFFTTNLNWPATRR